MTVEKLAHGERHRLANRKAKTEQAKYARLARVQREWQARQDALVRDQQPSLRAAFYARHPELAA